MSSAVDVQTLGGVDRAYRFYNQNHFMLGNLTNYKSDLVANKPNATDLNRLTRWNSEFQDKATSLEIEISREVKNLDNSDHPDIARMFIRANIDIRNFLNHESLPQNPEDDDLLFLALNADDKLVWTKKILVKPRFNLFGMGKPTMKYIYIRDRYVHGGDSDPEDIHDVEPKYGGDVNDCENQYDASTFGGCEIRMACMICIVILMIIVFFGVVRLLRPSKSDTTSSSSSSCSAPRLYVNS